MTTDEYVDVVDAGGAVIETVLKSEAHTRGLLHKTVIGQVFDSRGRWLLVKQSPGRQDAGQYVSPVGGHVSAGEAEEAALKREAHEEIGLQEDFTYTYVDRAVYERHVIGRHENHLFIMYKIVSDATPILNHESEGLKYFTEDELRSALKDRPHDFGDSFHFVITQFFPYLRAVDE